MSLAGEELREGHRLSGEMTRLCSYDGDGNLEVIAAGALRRGTSAEVVVWALLNYTVNASWNGNDEEDRAVTEVAELLARKLTW